MIQIKEVKTSKDIKDFLSFQFKLYKGNAYYVPAIYADEKAMFKKNFYYNKTCESIFFNAYKDGKMVGRIQGIIQRASNEKWNQQRVRFTRFDSIEDFEVSKALFDAIKKWAIAKGMNEIVGPLGYSDLEREGLLIEGFDYLSTYEEQYNYPYYQKLIEDYGFKKEVDWTERRLYPVKNIDPIIIKVTDKIMSKGKYQIAKFKNIDELIKKYGDQFFDLVDETYSSLYQTVPLFKEQREGIIKSFKLVLSPKYCCLIIDENKKLAAFGICFPAIGEALQKSGGHLTLPTLFRLIKILVKPKSLDLGLIGVTKEHLNSGVAWVILRAMMEFMNKYNINYCETNLNLEDNIYIQNNWKRFPNIEHKRRRSFLLKIDEKD